MAVVEEPAEAEPPAAKGAGPSAAAGEEDAREASSSSDPDDAEGGYSTELVALLLNFIKEYYMAGHENKIRAMLFDIASDGPKPRELGRWGKLSPKCVREAWGAFNVWKEDGNITMPAYYQSVTHRQDLECVVVKKNPDQTLDLSSHPMDTVQHTASVVKRRADPKLVRPRPVTGWYVPPFGAQGPEADAADAGAAPTPREEPAQPAQQQPPGAAGQAAPGGSGAQDEAWSVVYDFDGASYGPEYLALDKGDKVSRQKEEAGWALGTVLERARPGAAAGPRLGWYPAEFAKRVGT